MRTVDASFGPWPAIAIGLPLAVAAAAAGINSWANGDQRPLTPEQTYERDYGFCMGETGYDLQDPIWADASRKQQVGRQYIGSLAVSNGNEVTVIPGPPGEANLPGKRLYFDFKTIDGIRTLEPADTFTARFVAAQDC